MATIEMDMSEFKGMEKNTKLLEKSLKREQDNKDEIEKLRKNQIKTLKDNSKIVTIVKTTVNEEHLYAKRDPSEIISRLTAHQSRRSGGWEERSNHNVDHLMHQPRSGNLYQEIDWIADSFFAKTHSKSQPTEEVTTKGLDEYLVEAKKEIREEEEAKVSTQLERLDVLEKEAIETRLKYEEISSDLLKAQNDLSDMTTDNLELEDLTEALEETIKAYSLDELKEIVNADYNIFSAGKLITKIRKFVNKLV